MQVSPPPFRSLIPQHQVPPSHSHRGEAPATQPNRPLGEWGNVPLTASLQFSGLWRKTPEEKLRAAAALGDQNELVNIMKETRIENLNINQPDSKGRTPLTIATRGGHFEFVKTLLELKAKVNIQESGVEKDTALTLAAGRGDIEIVEALIEAKADLNLKDVHGNTAIFCAARDGHLAVVKALIKAGANVDLITNEKTTPLTTSIYHRHEEIAEALIQAKANLNAQSQWGNSALVIAVRQGLFKTVRLLIDAKADLDLKDKEGNTALLWAAQEGQLATVKALIQAGANLNLYNNDRVTPLSKSVYLGHEEIAEALIHAKADVDNQSKWGNSALIIASSKGLLKTVKLLIAAKANLNLRADHDDTGNTALLHAAGEGHTEIVKALVEAGADLHPVNKKGNTALNRAILNNHPTVAQIIQRALDRESKTPQKEVHAEVFKALTTGNAEELIQALENRLRTGNPQAYSQALFDVDRVIETAQRLKQTLESLSPVRPVSEAPNNGPSRSSEPIEIYKLEEDTGLA